MKLRIVSIAFLLSFFSSSLTAAITVQGINLPFFDGPSFLKQIETMEDLENLTDSDIHELAEFYETEYGIDPYEVDLHDPMSVTNEAQANLLQLVYLLGSVSKSGHESLIEWINPNQSPITKIAFEDGVATLYINPEFDGHPLVNMMFNQLFGFLESHFGKIVTLHQHEKVHVGNHFSYEDVLINHSHLVLPESANPERFTASFLHGLWKSRFINEEDFTTLKILLLSTFDKMKSESEQ